MTGIKDDSSKGEDHQDGGRKEEDYKYGGCMVIEVRRQDHQDGGSILDEGCKEVAVAVIIHHVACVLSIVVIFLALHHYLPASTSLPLSSPASLRSSPCTYHSNATSGNTGQRPAEAVTKLEK